MELLAPNGKKSNLAPEQYKLVRTPEFKEWFGDWENESENSSKVVDENGEPLVVYHGSNSKFFIFNSDLIGRSSGAKRTRRGVYFSSKKEVAETFIKKHYWTANFYKGNDFIYEVFLNLRNPNIIDGQGKNIIWLDKDIRDIELSDIRFNDNYEKGFVIRNTIDTIGDLIEYSDIYIVYNPTNIKLANGTNTTFDSNNTDIRYANGGLTSFKSDYEKTYKKWKSLVNMTKTELEKFYNSEEGKEAGLTPSEAKEKGIDSGRESARWIMKMKDISHKQWTPNMWRWAKKQIRFISRMRGNKGDLYDKKGNKTRKHTSLLIWGHNPEIYKFEYGGQILLAPNGVESNLTLEQYKLVREPAFKLWFGDWENDPENSSKVLDENGEPMVCFHGTNREFNIFDSKEIGQGSGNLGHYGYGFYFSEDIIEAKGYGSNILKCFLKIKNPFLHINKNFDLLKQHGFFGIDEKVAISIDFNDFYNKIALIDSKAYEFVKIAKEKGLDNVWDIYLENNSSSDSSIDLNSLYDVLLYTDLFKQNDYKVPDYVFNEIDEIGIEPKLYYDYEFQQSLHWVTNLGENSKEVTNVIKSLGFDGIIVGSEFVLFDSSQIKLADGSNINFDENNADIRYENGGIINKDNFYKNTFADFIEISENEIPKREPNFISDWNSKYWYEGDYIIRQSDHWGKMDTCIWLLDNLSVNKLTQAKCKLSDFKVIEDNTSFKNGGQINKQLMEKTIIENIIINPNEEYSKFVNDKAIDYVLLFPKYQNLTKEEAVFIYKYFSNYESLVDKNGNYIALIQWNYVYGSNNNDAKKDDELLRKFIEKMDKHGIIVFDYYNSVIEADKAVIDFVNAVRDRIKSIVSNVINKNNDSELEELNLLIELTEDTLKENESDEELQMYLELIKDTKSELIKSNDTKFEEGGIIDKETWKKWKSENINDNGIANFELKDGTEVFVNYADSIIKIEKRRFKNGLDVVTLKENYSPKKLEEINSANNIFENRIKELVFGNISFELSNNKESLVQKMDDGGQLVDDITKTENFKKWFEGSKFLNIFSGKPNIYYHQTHKDNLESIEKDGFNIDIVGARKGDTEMPDGVFLKNNDTDISVRGNSDDIQIPVYVSAKNTKYFDNRSKLTTYLLDDDIYLKRLDEFNTNNKEMSRRFEEVWSSDGKIKYERGTPEYQIQFEKQNNLLQDILTEWKYKTNELSESIRKRVTEIFKSEGYDSIVVSRDEGSFGRNVWTLVVFNPSDIKSAVNNIGTFDKNKKGIIYNDGGSVSYDKLISASTRFRPSETVVFDPPLEGKNGAKLISYTWSYEWTMTPNREGELKSKRISDWTQAEISADTGRDIVHQYTVLMPDGEYKAVSSDSVPILLGYIDRKELKSFPNLVTASKTLAKQQMQLAIMEAKKQEYDELYAKFEKAEKPEIRIAKYEELPFAKYHKQKEGVVPSETYFIMEDVRYGQYNQDYYDLTEGTTKYKIIDKPNRATIEQLTLSWISKRVEENGGKYPRGLYDLKNRVVRQKRKVENILNTKI